MRYLCVALALIASFIIFASEGKAEDVAINDGSKVAFDYILIVEGKVIDSSQAAGPLEYTQGDGKLLPGLTKQLNGMKVGDEKTVELKPEEAYGNPDPAGFKEIPLSAVPKDIKPEVGMVLNMQDQNGQSFPAKITEVKKDSIMVDLNHPLSGKTLIFKVKIVSIK